MKRDRRRSRQVVIENPMTGLTEIYTTAISDDEVAEWNRDREDLAHKGYPDRPPDGANYRGRIWKVGSDIAPNEVLNGTLTGPAGGELIAIIRTNAPGEGPVNALVEDLGEGIAAVTYRRPNRSDTFCLMAPPPGRELRAEVIELARAVERECRGRNVPADVILAADILSDMAAA